MSCPYYLIEYAWKPNEIEAQRAQGCTVTERWHWVWTLGLPRVQLAYRVSVHRKNISSFGHTQPHGRKQGLVSRRQAGFQS